MNLTNSKIEYFSQGQGEPIVLLPFGGLTVGYMGDLAQDLAKAGYRVVRIKSISSCRELMISIALPENGALLKKEMGERVTLVSFPAAGHLLIVAQPKRAASAAEAASFTSACRE